MPETATMDHHCQECLVGWVGNANANACCDCACPTCRQWVDYVQAYGREEQRELGEGQWEASIQKLMTLTFHRDGGVEKEPKTVEEARRFDRNRTGTMFLLLMLGANEMAKHASTLGERIYWRLFREKAATDAVLAGAHITFQPETDAILVKVPWGARFVPLFERDLQLMREAVEAFDEQADKKEDR